MRKIGIVASGSSETGARVILNEGEEKTVKVEDLVLIKNRNGNDVFAVCRGGLDPTTASKQPPTHQVWPTPGGE